MPTRTRARSTPPPDRLSFLPVTRKTRADFERLFEAPGGPKHCWCMVRRPMAAEARQKNGDSRRREMVRRIDEGVPVGLLAYADGAPVGWVSIAPRDTYRNLGGPPSAEGEVIWSIVCFYVPRRLRGQGTVRQLLAAAVDHARSQGATVVEAYPVDADSPSYRFMGFVPVFTEAGFAEVGRAGSRRHVMRLTVA